MECPQYGAGLDKLAVTDSRPILGVNMIRRRRECEACGHRFTTREQHWVAPPRRQLSPEQQLVRAVRKARLWTDKAARLLKLRNAQEALAAGGEAPVDNSTTARA